MSLVCLPSLQDYWRQNHVLSLPLPPKVMTRDRFRSIFWSLHLSDPEEDIKNDQNKRKPQYDKPCRIRPLYDEIRNPSQAYYQPRKPTKWGLKMFVLAESSNGYTVDFNIYTGKAQTPSQHGLAYDAVLDLIKPSYLGTGYSIYMDNFYTSPKLFTVLSSMKFGACGTYRENRQGCPKDRPNAMQVSVGR